MLRQLKASAGSGKTHELTQHFLELLAHARPLPYTPSCAKTPTQTAFKAHAWGDILAVTFTNRAAAEMKERVVRRLKEAALGKHALPPPWTPALAAGWVQCIIRQYGNLNIRTIDSLLRQMVAAAALELGLPPEFTPVYTSIEAVAPYWDALMERAWQGEGDLRMLVRECCRSLLFHTNHKGFLAGDRIAARFVALLDYALLHGLPERVGTNTLERAFAALTRAYAESACHMSRVLEEDGLSAHKNFVALLDKAPELNTAKLSVYLNKNGVEECLTGASKNKASRRAQDAYVRLCADAGALAEQGKLVRLALERQPFVDLLSRLMADFAEGQRRQGTLPAILIPKLARRSMEEEESGVSALLCRVSSRLTHILIDEFQDTSRTQWEALRPLALEALAQGGSLTWVGDVKQAVYTWRGGDVALFDALLRDPGLLAIVPKPCRDSLDYNWRSREEIVTFNNALFSLLALPDHALNALNCLLPDMPSEIIGEAAGDVSQTFKGARQLMPQDRPASRGGFVRVCPIEGENAAELETAVREELEQSIGSIAARRAWGEIAILTRSNEQAASAAAWLMEKGVPVLTENSLVLAEHPLVQQSIAFLRFVHNPLDEGAFWELSTAPLCTEWSGLSREVLHAWAARRVPGDLYLRFRDEFPEIWATLFAPFFSCGLMSAYDLLQEFFSRFKIMERFPTGAAFLRRLLEVAHAAEGQGYASLASFLEKWTQGGMEEKLPMPAGMDAVRVMTIHKAKGLEFPVVILPGTHFSLGCDNPLTEVTLCLPNAEGMPEETRLLVPRCKETGTAHYQAIAAAAREMLHVLYVAFTRATDELHVFLTKNMSSRQRKTMSAVLEALLPETGISIGEEYVQGAPRCTKAAQYLPHAPSEAGVVDMPTEEGTGWRPMHWLPRLRIHRAAFAGTDALRPEARGILAHRCLEFLTPTGQAQADAVRAVALGLGSLRMHLSPEQRDSLTDALAWYAALPQALSWMERGSPEHSLLDENNALHRVDMLVDEGDGYTALEYKSGKVEEGHVPQLRLYLALLERACGGRARGVLMYLDLRRCRCVTLNDATTLLTRPEEWT